MKLFLFILGTVVIICFWALLGGIAAGYISEAKADILTSIGGGASAGVWYYLVRCIKKL